MLNLFASADTGVPAGAVIVYLAIVALVIAGWWKIFTKAGEPGWKSIIPIYNILVMLKIVGRPLWWIVLLLIPCVGFVIVFVVMIDLAKSFGKSAAYGIGLTLLSPIFAPMLGFGSARYQGPSGPEKNLSV